jgi:hypothetical protein
MTLPFLQTGSAPYLPPVDEWGWEQPEDAQPLTASADSVVDAWGDTRFQDIDDYWGQDESTGELIAGIGPVLSSSLLSGVANADFSQGPPDPDLPLDDANPLPYWRWTGADGVDAYWVADEDAPSGHAVRFVIADGAASGLEFYLEQIIAISSADIVKLASSRWSSSTLMDAAQWSWGTWVQMARRDGLVTGAEYAAVADVISERRRTPFAIPTDATYARVRVGGETTATVTVGPGIGDVYQVSVSTPFLAWLTLHGEVSTLPATGSSIVPLAGSVSGDARRWQGGTLMWVVHVHARTSSAVSISSGGRLAVSVYDASASQELTPIAYLPNGNSDGYSYEPFAATAVVPDVVDIIRFQARVTAGTNSTTSASLYCTAMCAVVIDSTDADYS